MPTDRDEGPVYYREIQKNAYLKRIPNETTSKLLPLGHKKPPPKAMWTLFCVHNGRIPYLEQYPQPQCPSTLAHRPVWRACLRSARHVTCSVSPQHGSEYDFLIDTAEGPVRMLAPDWESMQDWVQTLRNKLHELRIMGVGENMYIEGPTARPPPPPLAPARDPTSPLPAPPHRPPDRVPGIDLTTAITRSQTQQQPTSSQPTTNPSRTQIQTINPSEPTQNPSETTQNPQERTMNIVEPSQSRETSVNLVESSQYRRETSLDVMEPSQNQPKTTQNLVEPSQNRETSLNFLEPSQNRPKITQNLVEPSQNHREMSSNLHETTESTRNQSLNVMESSEVPDKTQPRQEQEIIDISNWEPDVIPSTSQSNEPKKGLAKICGQNICLDDSILKRNLERITTESDEEFFAELDRISDSVDDLCASDSDKQNDHTQRFIVSDVKENGTGKENGHSDRPANITVIQVSNKPPHTAIPVLGPETNVFNFDFKQNVNVSDCNDRAVNINDNNDSIINIKDKDERENLTNNNEGIVNINNNKQTMTNISNNDRFVNIVNTEANDNSYGTIFTKESDYGHISLTTTVSLTGNVKSDSDGIYERLCLASTSNKSPLASKKIDNIRNIDKIRKSSLPNLDTESTYECLFPNNNNSKNIITVTQPTSLVLPREVNNIPVTRVTSNTRLNEERITTNTRLNNSTTRVITSDTNTRLNNSVAQVINSERNNRLNNSEERVNNSDNRVHVVTSTVAVTDTMLLNAVERSHSQNAYDRAPVRDYRRQHSSPKRDVKIEKEKSESAPKPIWKRGLTELSLLSKLRSLGQAKRQGSPSRKHNESIHSRGVTSPAAVRRSRGEGRDTARRRSSSLSNGVPSQPVPAPLHSPPAPPALVPLRARQAAWLRGEQRRGAAIHHAISPARPPVFADYSRQVWIASWNGSGAAVDGRAGDRVVCVAGTRPRDAAHARQLVKGARTHTISVLFHRVPLARVYVVARRPSEPPGLRLGADCSLRGAEPASPAHRAGLPPPGQWVVTEANTRPLVPSKNATEELNRLCAHGTESWLVLQPAALVSALRAAAGSHR